LWLSNWFRWLGRWGARGRVLLDTIRFRQRKDFDAAAFVTNVSHAFTLGRCAALRHASTRADHQDVTSLAPESTRRSQVARAS
jgi:hypothetical protein